MRYCISSGSIILAATFFLLGGCATAPDVKDMVVKPTAVEGKVFPEKLRNGVAVVNVAGGEETNPLWTSEVNSEGFKSALIQSLLDAELLDPDEEKARYQLIAVLLNVDQPFMGFNMTVTSTVEYTLLDTSDGTTVFRERVVAPYTAKAGQAFLGMERLKLANEGSIRENIRLLIERLSKLDL